MPTPWYVDGLSFSCTRCGKCCTGFPGYVWVEEDELQAIAEFRGETLEEVTALYTHVVNGDRSLRDKPNTDCIFYDASLGCTVYDARPGSVGPGRSGKVPSGLQKPGRIPNGPVPRRARRVNTGRRNHAANQGNQVMSCQEISQ